MGEIKDGQVREEDEITSTCGNYFVLIS